MSDEPIRTALQSLDLSQYQADAYAAVLKLGSAPAVDIASESDVPKSRIYDVLRALESDGYVETYEQDSLYARALDPDEVMSDLRSRAESLSGAAEQIEELWEAPAVDDHRITLVKRRDTVYEQAKRYIHNAVDEIQLATTPTQFVELRPALQDAFDRDVFIQLALYPAADGTPTDTSNLEFEGAVTEVRDRMIPAPFVMLADRSMTCFAPQSPALENSYGLIADNYPLAHVFHWYFQTTLWDAWEVIYSTRGEEPPIPYVNIRQCITDLEPLMRDGKTMWVTVEGIDTVSREPITVSGQLQDVVYTNGDVENGAPSLSDIAGQATIVVATDDHEYTVGGWYARMEDIEMRRLTLEAIEE